MSSKCARFALAHALILLAETEESARSVAMSYFLDDEAVELGKEDGYSSEEVPLVTRTRGKRALESSESDAVPESEEEESAENGQRKTAAARLLAGMPKRGKNSTQGGDMDVVKELKLVNETLMSLSDRSKETEKRVKAMEEKITSGPSSSSPSSGTPKSSRKKVVPQEVRVCC